MPARRQHRRGDGLTRKERTAQQRHEASQAPAWQPSLDQIWSEHQEWERARRAPLSAEEIAREIEMIEIREQRRARMWAEITAARDSVMADFTRWRKERNAHEHRAEE